MALAPTRFPMTSLFPSSSLNLLKPSPILLSPKIPRSLLSSASSSSSNQPSSPLISEQAFWDTVAFDAEKSSVPAVRTFENDLARLTIVAAVDFQQALTAAAADGGEAADEHISSGMDAMVVETIFPGPADDHSTVSTRLFLPARKVKEKAMKLKGAFTKDIFEGTPSKNILAMTFRQVVLQRLRNLELVLFGQGSLRNMDDLENPRVVPVFVTLSSAEDLIISKIAEVVCLAAIENTERNFLRDSTSWALVVFGWFKKKKRVSSSDNTVILYNFLEDEILSNAKVLLEKFKLERRKYDPKTSKLKNSCWESSAFVHFEKIGGPEFCAWISDCVPSYKLVIDAGKFSELKFDGWTKSMANNFEVLLTHSQMVSLSDILDMYYEDVFTLPHKQLSCSSVGKSSYIALNKGNSVLKIISMVLAGGILLVTITVLKKLYVPHLRNNNINVGNSEPQHSDINCVTDHTVESSKSKAC